uniref:Fe(3+)-transporting ATPase (LivF) n=1 Tax=uncultured marine group II/III euryarchaeote AD1000_87_H07 TaxID=1457819 RepID=A0A075FZK9_9EURY|nr:Fe(3+)-transporting ATPase (livF) [uncultured marine group II/III euryarchaeote AD1000_87_H07]
MRGLEGGYGSVQILYGIDMHVDEGEFVTIIGPNGCGKSTLIKTIFGIATYYGGDIEYRGQDVSGWRTDQLVNHGIAYVPQIDNVFPSLSVEENLQMGGNTLPNNILNQRIERSLEMFPGPALARARPRCLAIGRGEADARNLPRSYLRPQVPSPR